MTCLRAPASRKRVPLAAARPRPVQGEARFGGLESGRKALATRLDAPVLAAGMAFGIAMLLVGCGRKATEADCALILDRNVEIEMRRLQVTDEAAIKKRKDEIRLEMKDRLNECIGKRITDGMLACVRKADSADAIDGCLR